MTNDFTYYMPTKIVYANNSLEDIDKYINGRKTILVSSRGFEKRGLIQKIKSMTNYIVDVIVDVKSHPEFKDLEKLYEQIDKNKFELIVAVGGGSVLDASKFFSVYHKKRDARLVTDMIKSKVSKTNYKTLPIISIPTTSGTGSEITPWATIWDMDEKKKYSLHLGDLFSEVAIYDPVLTLSVPLDITIQTGLDTLSHALESIWNKNASPITINYAVKSAKLVMDNLVLLCNNLDSLKYRDNMMRACMYAGLAFSNTQTAIAHAMSYYITAHKGINHGIACSFTLPMLIDNIIGKYKFVDDALLEIFGELSSTKLRKLLKQLNISTEFKDYKITNYELEKLKLSLSYNRRGGNSLVSI
ncbi:MAG: phosphonoacetaldehyde reductase [Sulfurovum sp.]|nr:phosphonoacetaldehyde reductase [Sulfurovaceae bacterium]